MESACDFKNKSGRTLRQWFRFLMRLRRLPLQASRLITAYALLPTVLLQGCHPAISDAVPSDAALLACIENCHQVTPVLYRSAQPDRKGFSALQQAGIRSVLKLREYHSDTDKARHTSLCLMAYPMAAGEVTEADVENCLWLIADAPKPILVHCWHGSDRSGIIIAAYLIVYYNKSVDEAEAVLRDKRFGHHEFRYGNLSRLLHNTNWDAMRQRLKKSTPTTRSGSTEASSSFGSCGTHFP